jgi:hypothetical protein
MTDPTTLSAAELDTLEAVDTYHFPDGHVVVVPRRNWSALLVMARRTEAAERKIDRLRALVDDERYGDEVIGKLTIRRALAED